MLSLNSIETHSHPIHIRAVAVATLTPQTSVAVDLFKAMQRRSILRLNHELLAHTVREQRTMVRPSVFRVFCFFSLSRSLSLSLSLALVLFFFLEFFFSVSRSFCLCSISDSLPVLSVFLSFP